MDAGQFLGLPVLALGDTRVGKTTLYKVCCGETVVLGDESTTIGVDYSKQAMMIETVTVPVVFALYDTAGQEKYRSLVGQYFRKGNIILLAYDITSRGSFDSLDYWLEQLRTNRPDNNYVVAVIGNKTDLIAEGVPRAVSVEEARDWMMARDLPAHHFETSALDGPEAIREILAGLAKSYIKSGPLKVFLKDSPPSTESREGRATSTANQTFILSMDPKDWFPQPIDGADKCCQTA